MIWFSFFVALLIQIMPWPDSILAFRPNWILLILFYWVFILPDRINVGTSFIVGIMLDLVNGFTLGIHALSMSIVTYLFTIKFIFFRNLVLWQQAFLVIILSITENIIVFLITFLLTDTPSFRLELLWSSIVDGIVWPWLFLLMRKIFQ